MSDTPRRVPAELTDVVVDFLHDDKKSLKNCALVSKEWLPVARYHLFREICIRPSNVYKFKKLITHRSATVMPHHIHSVVIDGVKPGHTKLFDTMYRDFRYFDSVRTLQLRGIRWGDYREDSLDRLVSVFRSVTDMTVDVCIFDRSGDLLSLVARFPLLQRLSVTFPGLFQSLSHRDISENLPPPKIHDLVLRESDSPSHILEWFSFHGHLVDSLSVQLGTSALQDLNRYLEVLGPSLLFFTTELWHKQEEIFVAQLDLSFNTHLRKLRLPTLLFGSSHLLSYEIPRMFARITSSDLEEIEFPNIPDERRFLWRLEDDARYKPPSESMWNALDGVLSGFSSLRTIRSTFSPWHSDPLLCVACMMKGLSSCNARGLLSFE